MTHPSALKLYTYRYVTKVGRGGGTGTKHEYGIPTAKPKCFLEKVPSYQLLGIFDLLLKMSDFRCFRWKFSLP